MSKFKLLLESFQKRDSPPPALTPATILPGSSTLDKLRRLHTLRKASKLSPQFQNSIEGVGKPALAICFLIVDKLIHEAVWENWSRGASDKYEVKVFIHAKYPDRVIGAWTRRHLLPTSFLPEWNSPEVVRAMLYTLTEAVRDTSCQRFLFATETCLPLYRMNEVCDKLFEEDVSWALARHEADSTWERSACFDSVDPTVIPPSTVWKAVPGWIMLTRKHAVEVCLLPLSVQDDLVRAWGDPGPWSETKGGVFAPEEVYFSTLLSILGYLRPQVHSTDKDEVKRVMVTFAEWSRRGAANPITFHHFDQSLVMRMRQEKSLFGRKFSEGSCSWTTWMDVIARCDGMDVDVRHRAAAAAAAVAAVVVSAVPLVQSTMTIQQPHHHDHDKDDDRDCDDDDDVSVSPLEKRRRGEREIVDDVEEDIVESNSVLDSIAGDVVKVASEEKIDDSS